MALRYYSSVAVATDIPGGCTSGATSITIGAATGLPSSYPYTFIFDPETVDEEVVEVTNRSGTTLTVTRGVDGTSAVAHSAGAVARHGFSARDFADPAVGGLQGVASGTFSAASAVNVDNVFDGTYDDYRLVLSVTPSAASVTIMMRLRASSSDASGSDYAGERHVIGINSVGNENGSDRWQVLLCDSSTTSRMGYDIFAPALTEPTSFVGFGHSYHSAIGFYFGYGASGHYTLTTAFDGFSIFPSSGTITGRWALFGYRAV